MRSIADVCFDNIIERRKMKIFYGVTICFDLKLRINNYNNFCFKQHKQST